MIKNLQFIEHNDAPSSMPELISFQSQLNTVFPPPFIEFCLRWNGGLLSDSNNCYMVPARFEGFHAEYGSTGVVVEALFGFPHDIKYKYCSVLKEFEALNIGLETRLLPIAFDIFGNYVVMYCDGCDGRVFWKDHALWETPERPYLIPLADDLEQFYNSLAVALMPVKI